MDPTIAAEELEKLVRKSWDDTGQPAYLATVGGRLSDVAKSSWRSTGLPLRMFVESYLSQKLRQVNAGEGRDLVVPIDAAASLSDAELRSLAGSRVAVEKKPKFPSFQKDVWWAFSRPLGEMKRFIQINDDRSAKVLEIDQIKDPPDGALQITQLDLPNIDPTLGYPKAHDIAEAISTWATKHAISIVRLYNETLHAVPTRSITASHPNNALDNNSLRQLQQFLEVLEPQYLQKFQIPGDILLSIIAGGRK